jgi:hypothetical protein
MRITQQVIEQLRVPDRRQAALVAMLVCIGAAAGCRSDAPVASPVKPGTGRVELTSLVPRGAVQAAVQQYPATTDGTVTFSVRVLANGVGVGAYSGSITFVPGAFELVDVTLPHGADGEARFQNPGGFDHGVIRFAGFTPTTFAGTSTGDGAEALRFTVRVLTPIESANMRAALNVVSGETGVAISAEQVLASPGVYGVDGRLIK